MVEYDIEIVSVDDITSMQKFDQLQTRMKQFSEQLSMSLTNKRHEMINQSQHNQLQLFNLKNEEKKLTKTIEDLQNVELKVKHQLKQAIEQLQVQRNKVDDLSLKQETLTSKKIELTREIDELTKSIDSIRKTIMLSNKNLQAQMSRDYPELVKYETYLGLKVYATSNRQLRFTFVNLDPKDINRQFWIEIEWELENSTRLKSDPILPQHHLDQLLSYLTDDNNSGFLKFLINTRKLFKDSIT